MVGGTYWSAIGLRIDRGCAEFLGRCDKDVEQLWVKMFAPVLEHEFNRMTDFKGRLVDPLRGQGIKCVGNRGNAAFDGNGLALSTCEDILCRRSAHGECRR